MAGRQLVAKANLLSLILSLGYVLISLPARSEPLVVRFETVSVLDAPSRAGKPITTLRQGLQIDGVLANPRFWRITLESGQFGYVPRISLEKVRAGKDRASEIVTDTLRSLIREPTLDRVDKTRERSTDVLMGVRGLQASAHIESIGDLAPAYTELRHLDRLRLRGAVGWEAFFQSPQISDSSVPSYSLPSSPSASTVNSVLDKCQAASSSAGALRTGRGIAARLVRTWPLVVSPEFETYAQSLGEAVRTVFDANLPPLAIGVIDSDAPLAFASPGGYILVSSGLIAKMQNEAQFVGVLAHEITHLACNHMESALAQRPQALLTDPIINRRRRVSSIPSSQNRSHESLVAMAVVLVGQGLPSLVQSSLDILLTEGYRVDDEFEADRGAAEILLALNYDAKAFSKLVTQIADVSSAYTATHPSTSQRHKLLTKFFSSIPINLLEGDVHESRWQRHTKFIQSIHAKGAQR